MPATYEPIATQTLGSAAASITFSSIPASWTDLRLVVTEFGAGNYAWFGVRFNSDSGTNYSGTLLRGNGASASSARDTSANRIDVIYDGVAGTTIPALFEVDVFSYANSTNKTILARTSGDRNGAGQVGALVGLWRNTAAITTIGLIAQNFNFGIGTTATLYGIASA